MMDDDKSPVSVDVGIKAEAKIDIKTEIPSETSGRFVDALTDIIRPFSERRGLEADLLRRQREEVLIEIAQLARQRAAIDNIEVKPVPTKFLVKFLEKASLEDESSDLKQKWAALLVNASAHYDDRFAIYIDVLQTLTGAEARLLDNITPRKRFTEEYLYKDQQRKSGFRSRLTRALDSAGSVDLASLSRAISLAAVQEDRFRQLEEEAREWHGEYDTLETLTPEHELFLKLAAIAPDNSAILLAMTVSTATGYETEFRSIEEIRSIAEIANLERNNLVASQKFDIVLHSINLQLDWTELTPFGRLFVQACDGETT